MYLEKILWRHNIKLLGQYLRTLKTPLVMLFICILFHPSIKLLRKILKGKSKLFLECLKVFCCLAIKKANGIFSTVALYILIIRFDITDLSGKFSISTCQLAYIIK